MVGDLGSIMLMVMRLSQMDILNTKDKMILITYTLTMDGVIIIIKMCTFLVPKVDGLRTKLVRHMG